VEPHPRFQRKGNNIHSKLSLKLSEALLGCSKQVETVWALRRVTVPPCTQPGCQIVIEGEGAPRLGSNASRGHHVLEVSVVAPSRLTPEQMRLIESLRDSGI
jgi:curved DNA-binding protein